MIKNNKSVVVNPEIIINHKDINVTYDKENDNYLLLDFKTKEVYMAWCYYYGFPIDHNLLSTINNNNE
jgi:hypothetical protein